MACLAGCHAAHKQRDIEHTIRANPAELPNTAEARKHHNLALGALRRDERRDQILVYREFLAATTDGVRRAEHHLEKAIAADPTYGPAHNTLGSLHFHRGDLYRAAWEFDQASRYMPTRPEPLNNLGLVYEEAGRLDQAISYYSEAIELAPDTAEYLGNLARAQFRSGASLDEYRGVLEQLTFVDTRHDWRAWAKDQLGLHPIGASQIELASATSAPAEEADPLPEPPRPERIPLPERADADPPPELINPLNTD